MEAFSRKQQLGFLIHAFSEVEQLERFAEKTQIEILLIAGRNMSEKISQMNIGKILLLSDGEVCEEFSDYESIYKYQSADHIMKEILCHYAEYARPVTSRYYGEKQFEVYGVYSPIGRCGKSVLARSLAKSFGKTRKTLLLDLQSFSALEEQRSNDNLWDLTDIIYFLRQGKRTFLYKLNSIVRSEQSYDYVLPMKSFADLRSVTVAEWTELLEKLALDSDYQVVVIDFGTDVSGIFQILSQCTKIYVPVLPDTDSKTKMENFEWILKEENFKKVRECIQKVYLPNGFERANVKLFMEDWAEKAVMS
jgi:cellulose biosynthesis protein BcsQ